MNHKKNQIKAKFLKKTKQGLALWSHLTAPLKNLKFCQTRNISDFNTSMCQNISKKVLLEGLNFFIQWEWQKFALLQRTEDQGTLRITWVSLHKIWSFPLRKTQKKLHFVGQQWLQFIFGSSWHFITKCDNYFTTKCVRLFITKCDILIMNFDNYYKMRQFC